MKKLCKEKYIKRVKNILTDALLDHYCVIVLSKHDDWASCFEEKAKHLVKYALKAAVFSPRYVDTFSRTETINDIVEWVKLRDLGFRRAAEKTASSLVGCVVRYPFTDVDTQAFWNSAQYNALNEL